MTPKPRSRTERERSNMRHVAERAGVAVSSVSRVLNGHPDVSERMRERVMNAVADLAYHPDLLAQSMRWGSTLTCGLIVNDISNPLFAEIAKGAGRELDAAGYSMLLTNTDGNPERDVQAIHLLSQRRADGLLVSLASETHEQTLELLGTLDVPVVLIDRDVPAESAVARVVSDHSVGIRTAVEHLAGEGHRRIAIIVADALRPSNERARAFEDAVRDSGDDLTGEVVRVPYSAQHAADAVRDLLSQPQSPSAIIVGGNLFLTGVLETVAQLGLRIGRDLALVGCDDTELARLHTPPIAAVTRDMVEMGRIAANQLLRSMRGEPVAPEPVVVPTTFVPRASTANPG